MSLFAHATRSMGLDKNPLRRGTDRVEGWARLTATVIMLVVTPVITIAAACATYEDGTQAELLERNERHEEQARLLQDPASSAQAGTTVLAQASWRAGDETNRTGWVQTTVGATAGAAVPIWIDRRGDLADPPRDHDETLAATIATAVLIPLGILLMLAITHLILRIVLDRRRLSQWQRAWQAIEPGWSGRDEPA
ncbi:MAG: hypothetical protein JXA67_15720 [Micromonosporaceae bacterium]|nr:hypothetical protein [Micromonosporaceae bacterium]